MSTDRVILRDGGRQMSAPWPGPWPPPEKLYAVAYGEQLGIVDPDVQPQVLDLALHQGAMLFVRVSASEITEPAREDDHWFRGALYERSVNDF